MTGSGRAWADGDRLRAATSGAVFLGGAAAYAALEGPGGLAFDLTPLFVGVVAVVAGLSSTRRRPLATGLVLAGWGTAVVLVDHGVVPQERMTPAYMLGIGAGLLAVAALAPRRDRGDWLSSGVVAACLGPLGLYLTFDVGALGRWPAWALTLVAVAGWELFWSFRGGGADIPDPLVR